MKKWLADKWRKFRNWIVGILIAIGLVSVPIVMAGTKDFSWQNPTQYTDGSVFDPAVDQQEVRLYCTSNGIQIPVMVVPGNATNYTANLASGDYECYATVVSVEGAESFPSNTVTFTVDPLIPQPPVLN